MLLWFIAWYIVGLIGCAFGCTVDVKSGQDFKFTDLLTALLFSLSGPIIFVCGVVYFARSRWEFRDFTIVKGRK